MLLAGSGQVSQAGFFPGRNVAWPTGVYWYGPQPLATGGVITEDEAVAQVDLNTIKRVGLVTAPTWPDRSAFDWGGTLHRYQEFVASSAHTYQITMGGTVDEQNTITRSGQNYLIDLYQPNVSLKVENTGTVPVVNPKIVVNGRRNWGTLDDILDEILADTMLDREKALAIWYFVKENLYHDYLAEYNAPEFPNPVKLLNVYGYGLCGDKALMAMALWERAGLPARLWQLYGHVVSEVWYDGAYHVLDTDASAFYLLPDNRTAASVEQVSYDHDLAKRTHHFDRFEYGSYTVQTDEVMASLYGHNDAIDDSVDLLDHEIRFTLRPQESFEWRWDEVGKYHDLVGEIAPPRLFADGKAVYEPALDDNLYREYLEAEQNVRSIADDGQWPKLHLGDDGTTGYIVLKVESPYVIVGGKVGGEFYRSSSNGAVNVYISFDGQAWQKVWSADQVGSFVHYESIDRYIAPLSDTARYAYFIKFEFESAGGAIAVGMNGLRLKTDVQMAPFSLPALALGPNTIVYSDETAVPHQVLITHEWWESSPTRPPAPPLAPLYPADGSEVPGTRFTFAWSEAVDPDGDEIKDYHFVLSDRPDLAWPLSPNFDRVVPTSTFQVPYDGLLNDNTRYYWRVRSRDVNGVWSGWSDVWSFVPHGPAAPLSLHFSDLHTLSWSPNPEGPAPLYYKVYGSNEKGFTPADQDHVVVTHWIPPYQVVTETIASNLIATTTMVSFQAIQEVPDYPNQNRYYYRVVAVDANGTRSAPTLQVAVDRQFIYSTPITETRVGQPYEYQVGVVYSIEDLEYYSPQPIPYMTDVLSYSLLTAPDWMAIDRRTGLVTGMPCLGIFDVVIQVVNSVNQATTYQSFQVAVDRSKTYLPVVMVGGSQ